MIVLQDIIDVIKQYHTIIIHRHVRPDPDAIGSQVGLKEIIQYSFPDKQVFAVGEEEPTLNFLAKMDVIKDEQYKDALVIVCDTANTARISDERFQYAAKWIKIDHHPNVDEYGDIQWVDTTASSTSEMIYEFYLQTKQYGLKCNDKAARLLYAGIVGDTGRFLFPSTTKQTLKIAAELVTFSFDRTALYDGMYRMKDNIARLKGYILEQFSLSDNGMSAIKLTKAILNRFEVQPSETSQLVGVLGDIDGILAWVTFIEEDDTIRVRLRSKGPVINDLAAKYNGGGHPMASGASVSTWKETEDVIADLEQICEQYQQKM